MNKKEAFDAMKIGKKIIHPILKETQHIDWIAIINPSSDNELVKRTSYNEDIIINPQHTIIFSNGNVCNDLFFFSNTAGLPETGYEIYDEFKNDTLSYFMFMYNMWMEEICKDVFKNADCGWKHLWNKWIELINAYGYDGAIARYLCELSENYADTLVRYAISKYNGRKRI